MQQARLRHHQPNSFLGTLSGSLLGLGILVLVMLGVSGTIYKVVSPDGFMAGLFGKSISAGVVMLGSLTLIGLCAWFTGALSTHRTRDWLSNIVVYGSAALGLVYLLHFWWTGVF